MSQPDIDVPVLQIVMDGDEKTFKPVTDDDDAPTIERMQLRMMHNFFASCHGKGPSDAETARTKTRARDLERRGTAYMTYSKDLFTTLKPLLEVLKADAKTDELRIKSKERHTLYRRQLLYVPLGLQGGVRRPRVAKRVVGLEGKVSSNHCFAGVGLTGEIDVRWLPCSCDECLSVWGASSTCQLKEFNTVSTREQLAFNSGDTAASDNRISARAGRVARRLAQCKDAPILVAAVHNSGHRTGPGSDPTATYLTPFWLGETAGVPYEVRSGSSKEWMVDVYWYEEAPIQEPAPVAAAAAAAPARRRGRRRAATAAADGEVVVDCRGPLRVTYLRPKTQRCTCKRNNCKKWCMVPIPVASIRPPLLTKASWTKYFKPIVAADPNRLHLSLGYTQEIMATIEHDECFFDANAERL